MIFAFCGMRLPNADMIDREAVAHKVLTYCLNSDHEKGGPKAYLFQRLLGITANNSDVLTDAIYTASQGDEADFVKTTPYCDIYEMYFFLVTPYGSARVRTGWCVYHDTSIPHLTTAYIKQRQ
jgi:hypothetical protein